ncbi:MAG: hypothetical protein KF813_04545 [Trueperaceae bacterium]|nr:hypothetical protein [Trueperaceae bacterium]
MKFTRPQRRTTAARLTALSTALLLLIAACGQSTGISLGLLSPSAQLIRGGEVEIQVTLTRTGGAAADVGLAVSGLPANTSASFAPATLTGGAATSTLTISSTAAVAEGTYSLSVVGSGTGLSTSTPLSLTVTSLSVTGRLVDLSNMPVQGASVSSQGDTDTTNADGSFELSGLSIPYDLSVWSLADDWLHVIEGLTVAEVSVPAFGGATSYPPARSADVSGTLSGGVIPVPANQMVIVCVEGVNGFVQGCDTASTGDSSYSFTAEWYSSTSRQVRIHALQLEMDAGGYPVAFPGYASMTVTLTNSAPTVANLNLGSELETREMEVLVDADVAIGATVGAVQVGPNLALRVMGVYGPATSHVVDVPVIAGASYTFAAATALNHFSWNARQSGSTVTVHLPEVAAAVLPTAGMDNITLATAFTATNPAGGALTFSWEFDTGFRTAVTTMSSSHTLPPVADYGFTIPPGEIGEWQVISHAGPTIEEGLEVLLDYINTFSLLLSPMSQGPSGTGTVSSTSLRDFKMAP